MVTHNHNKIMLYYIITKTSLGWVGISGNEQGLRRLVLPEKTRKDVLKQLIVGVQQENKLILTDNQFFSIVQKIKEYFDSKPVQFDHEKINLSGYTTFQKDVLLKTREIPYGETRTYRWLAERAGYPRAYRAVGGVMRINPLPLIIPCHRVIGSQGKLTGFSAAGGLRLKQRMLELEGGYDG